VVERPAWNLAGEWQIGAGAIRVGYALADDTDVNGATVNSSGAKQYQIGYWHNLSKRTKLYAAYVKLDNDSFGQYNLTGLNAGPAGLSTTTSLGVKPGDSADVVAFGIFHTF